MLGVTICSHGATVGSARRACPLSRWAGAAGLRNGPGGRARRTGGAWFTHFAAVVREIPIFAATRAIRLVRQGSSSRQRPLTINGALV